MKKRTTTRPSRSGADAAPDGGDQRERAWNEAVRLLALRDRSEPEVRAQLEGFSGADVDAVVARLRELRYLDDERFARGLAERLARRGFGCERLRHELSRHDLDHELVEAVVGVHAAGDVERARTQLERRHRGIPSTPRERAQALRFLHGRGFSEDVVLAIMGRDW